MFFAMGAYCFQKGIWMLTFEKKKRFLNNPVTKNGTLTCVCAYVRIISGDVSKSLYDWSSSSSSVNTFPIFLMWCVLHFPLTLSLCWRNQSDTSKCGRFRTFDVLHRFLFFISSSALLFLYSKLSLPSFYYRVYFSTHSMHTHAQCCLEDLHSAIF